MVRVKYVLCAYGRKYLSALKVLHANEKKLHLFLRRFDWVGANRAISQSGHFADIQVFVLALFDIVPYKQNFRL